MKAYFLGFIFLVFIQSCEKSSNDSVSLPKDSIENKQAITEETAVVAIQQGSILKIASTDDPECFIVHLNDKSLTQLKICSPDQLETFRKVNMGYIYKVGDRCSKKIFYVLQVDLGNFRDSNIQKHSLITDEEDVYEKCN